MKFIPMKELLEDARRGSYAVPSFCVWNAETMLTVLETAEALRSPLIIMNGPVEVGLLPAAIFAEMARLLAAKFNVPCTLHLDHGDSMELVKEAIAAGYTSVMLDYSSKPFEENAAALKEVAKLAKPKGITVEGEIGHVGKADTFTAEGAGDSTLTTPEEAAEYVAATGVDALAVSIGNAHGQYTRLPKLDFDRLAKIRSAVATPLVLHGGSGTPDADLKRVISLGMVKINVATDLVAAWRDTLMTQWNAKRNMWAPAAMTEAKKAMIPPVERWLKLTGAAGHA